MKGLCSICDQTFELESLTEMNIRGTGGHRYLKDAKGLIHFVAPEAVLPTEEVKALPESDFAVELSTALTEIANETRIETEPEQDEPAYASATLADAWKEKQ